MRLDEIPIRFNWFASATRIAEALGLRIELPDLEIEDRDYWDHFDRDAWRAGLRGKVAMTDEELQRIDADWYASSTWVSTPRSGLMSKKASSSGARLLMRVASCR